MNKIFNKTVGLNSSYNHESNYFVHNVTKTMDKIILHYFFDDWSSVWIEDKETFDIFPKKYRVMSGGWYGKEGRWRTLKRIVREIICEGVKELSEQNYKGKNYIKFTKESMSSNIDVTVFSEMAGKLNFKCVTVGFTDHFQLFVFDNELKTFVDATHLIPDGLTFIGKL